MPKSVFTGAHEFVVEVLVAARRESGLKQTELAARIGRPQSFISNIERGQRRIDVLEFYALARAMSQDPAELYRKLVDKLPSNIRI